MNIQRWERIYKKGVARKGGMDMATISFDREIILNDTSAEALIRKIEYDKKNPAVLIDTNIEKKLQEGRQLLKQLFCR